MNYARVNADWYWEVTSLEATTRIEIEDTGCGIAANELRNIFDRYYRNGDDEESSAGLGLAIVKRIVDLHDSRITVVSEVQRGTTFSFELANTA